MNVNLGAEENDGSEQINLLFPEWTVLISSRGLFHETLGDYSRL